MTLFVVSCSNQTEETLVIEQASTVSQIEKAEQEETEQVSTPRYQTTTITQQSLGVVPTRVIIPSIDVSAPVAGVGLNASQEMIVPDDPFEVGWFNRGTKPGNTGSAVLAGHVDSRTGPAIFFELEKITIGDQIIVEGEDGTELTFQVVEMNVYPYDDAPIREIFGSSTSRRLNVITCTGEFDRVERTHRERLVVTAELLEPTM